MPDQDAPAGPVLGEEVQREVAAFLLRHGLVPTSYAAVETAAMLLRLVAPHLSVPLSFAREEAECCPNCDHLPTYHHDGACWFAVGRGRTGADLVCPCAASS